MVVNLVKVLLGGEGNSVGALVGREELQAFLLVLEGIQGSSLSGSKVVRNFVCRAVVGGEDFNNLVGCRSLHAVKEVLQWVMDQRSEVKSGILCGCWDELKS